MFLGHFGVGFGAKRAAPGVSLGTLFAACQLADLLWPTLVLFGLERFEIRPGITAVTPLDFVSSPYSHSLVALSVWGILYARQTEARDRIGSVAFGSLVGLVRRGHTDARPSLLARASASHRLPRPDVRAVNQPGNPVLADWGRTGVPLTFEMSPPTILQNVNMKAKRADTAIFSVGLRRKDSLTLE